MGRFWPVVGLLGLRQSGKSTLFRDLLGLPAVYSLDDEETLDDVRLSAKNFLRKLGAPVVIDEAQKAPLLFDAIKLLVDARRAPGQFFLTGSSEFSSKKGIQESLTGRIGIIHLYPFTLAEAHRKPFCPERVVPVPSSRPRFEMSAALERLTSGGLPVALFTRDRENRRRYLRNWLETSILRDAAKVYGANYDPDVSWSILRQMGQALREGEYPSLLHFKQPSRVLRRYLGAMEAIFLLRKIPCHEAGTGQDVWMPTDGGIACEIMETEVGEGTTLTLARIFVLNEILANAEYSAYPIRPVYFKSARGTPIDLVWNDSALRVSVLPKSQNAYDERPLSGAMKKLGFKRAVIAVPRDDWDAHRSGISVLPWSAWS